MTRPSPQSPSPSSSATSSSPTSPNVTVATVTKKGKPGKCIYISAHSDYHIASPQLDEGMILFTYKVVPDPTVRHAGRRGTSEVYRIHAPTGQAFKDVSMVTDSAMGKVRAVMLHIQES